MEDASQTPDIEKIRQLVSLMQRRGLGTLSLTENGVTVRLEAEPAAMAPPVVIAPVAGLAPGVLPLVGDAAEPESTSQEAPEPDEEDEPEGVALESPTTGMFYRAPAPGEANFVEVGDEIEVGQTIGIIMAMKVMSEIPAEVAGEIVAIPAADGALVQSGEALIYVRPL